MREYKQDFSSADYRRQDETLSGTRIWRNAHRRVFRIPFIPNSRRPFRTFGRKRVATAAETKRRKAVTQQRAGSRKESPSADRSSRPDRARFSRRRRFGGQNNRFRKSISRFAALHRETPACSDA